MYGLPPSQKERTEQFLVKYHCASKHPDIDDVQSIAEDGQRTQYPEKSYRLPAKYAVPVILETRPSLMSLRYRIPIPVERIKPVDLGPHEFIRQSQAPNVPSLLAITATGIPFRLRNVSIYRSPYFGTEDNAYYYHTTFLTLQKHHGRARRYQH